VTLWSALQNGPVCELTNRSPTEPNTLTTKRIIALEGDLVYPVKPSMHSVVRIPEGHCWVEGDSRHRSRDSNTYGPVSNPAIGRRKMANIRSHWL
jgi:inner membrane protease subunit 2